MMSLVKFGLETVQRPMGGVVTPNIIAPTMAPVKFVMIWFIPFLKMTAAILMTLPASFALGPRIRSYCQNKTN